MAGQTISTASGKLYLTSTSNPDFLVRSQLASKIRQRWASSYFFGVFEARDRTGQSSQGMRTTRCGRIGIFFGDHFTPNGNRKGYSACNFKQHL
jgi:hypothetical protein